MRTFPLPNASSTLVGRERELGLLREHLAAALAGQGSLVLIGGEAGIGKTALAEAFCLEAMEQGALVLVGRCYDLTETPPYGPWVELFARYRPVDDLPPLPDAFARRGTVGAVSSQAALLQQMLDFFTALCAARPLVLLLDDLHWADPASLDLLRFLARNLAALPLLLLAAYRSDEVALHPPLYPLLPTLVHESGAARLDLHPLDPVAVRALVAAHYPLPEADAGRLVAYLDAHTEGNPFFIGEMLRTLAETGVLRLAGGAWQLGDLARVGVPPLLRQIIDGRVGRLDAESQRLLALAAVVGHTVPLDVWAVVGGVDEERVIAVAERAEEARLLTGTPEGDGVRFVHALIREALYAGIPSMRRRGLHRAVAEAFAATAHPDPDTVAYHFQRADDARALPWLLRAGERAQGASAWPMAAERFTAALALMEREGADAAARGWVLLRLSHLLRYVEVAKSRALADEAYTLAEAGGDRVLAAYSRLERGMARCHAGDAAHGLPDAEAGAEALAALSETERAAFAAHAADNVELWTVPEARAGVVFLQAHCGHFRQARTAGEALVAAAQDGDETVQQDMMECYFGLGDVYAALGMPEEAAAMFARAHDGFLRGGLSASAAANTSEHELEWVVVPYRTEDLAARQRLAARAQAEWARASGIIPVLATPGFSRMSLLLLEGEWDEAERLAAVVSKASGMPLGILGKALQYRAALARLRGEREQAWAAVHAWLPAGSASEPESRPRIHATLALQRVAVMLALDAGDLAEARAWLQIHIRWMEWSGAVLGQSEGQTLWAHYHRQAGDMGMAYEHAERALAHATAPRQPLALLAAHRLRGELDTESGRYDGAGAHLTASLALADACAAPYERALTLLALAELRTVQGETATARALLDDVQAICTPLGARPALARAAALEAHLAALNAAAPTYPAGLSAREVEVLRLVATGRSNREIADLLFLSPGTVGIHVTHILAKTGTTNRTEAAAFARDHGIA